ncbi:DNA polymerase subunit beta [Haloferax sp. Atlit-4N]|uniref:nucleotidyltransferase domain-containing protein n=1 Tax=unclassified Haloferax TaxID=2625095 RepID=UPI000E27E461|nr:MULTISPECIES: nucleotidyltransferase domain-containing protein [unclassified Haloferax]RDZ39533.1 DNA polymerase subunit beta [Haloferax sp. Atlit-19N]RDZ49830.1 DNA polymerase subunit beta [Haloferax sp. Atlit-4N]
MEPSDGRSEVLSALREAVCSDSDLEFVVTFGSQITGEATTTSDLDIAVKLADSLSARDRFEKQCFLSGDLQWEDAPFVDLSDIETLPLAVAHDAVRGSFVCGDDQAFEQFKTETEAQFAEQRDDLRRQRRAVIDRIAEEGLRG